MGSTTHLPRIQPDGRRTGQCGPRRRERKRTVRALVNKNKRKSERETNEKTEKEGRRKRIQEREEQQAAEWEEKKGRTD